MKFFFERGDYSRLWKLKTKRITSDLLAINVFVKKKLILVNSFSLLYVTEIKIR